MRQRIVFALTLFLLAAGIAAADERVQGADQFKPGADLDALTANAIVYPMKESELELLASNIEAIDAWVEENREAWHGVRDADDLAKAILALPVWETVDITAGEFVLMSARIRTMGLIEDGLLSLEMLDEEIEQVQAFLERAELPDDELAAKQAYLRKTKAIRNARANYPESNHDFYQAHEEQIELLRKQLNDINR